MLHDEDPTRGRRGIDDKAEFAPRGLSANGQCKKALASLKMGHEREMKMVAAEIDYLEKALKA